VTTSARPASEATRNAQRAVHDALPFHDRRQYDEASRGFVASLDPCIVSNAEGGTAWDMEQFHYLAAEAPDTVNPSLWRNAQLSSEHGLFQVADGIYQIRGFDISNMSVVVGETGYVVIDPLVSAEVAKAGMDVVREHLGDRPVTGVIYSHSHVDHFGGVKGVLSAEDAAARNVPIVAPEDFLGHAISENIYAGNAMSRRAAFMYGMRLPRDGQGLVTTGLGPATSLGGVTLLAPTHHIGKTGEELVIDGVRIVFQVTPDAEAPSDMNFYFPEQRALCLADNVVHTMHNLYTLRGAQVRDAIGWSEYLNEILEMFGDEAEVVFLGHQWPVWGNERCVELLRMQRDLYRFIHDETLRLANQGHTLHEIPEIIEVPEALATYWSNRGYYGTLSHNCKAVYQKYLGYFDGNPAHLDPHPPVEAARRYVDALGGVDALLATARASYDAGDYRWVVELVNHAVFAEPDHRGARELQADALEQLGYQAESATWRNFYLVGAMELRQGTPPPGVQPVTPDMLTAMTVEMIISYLAIRIVGPRAAEHPMVLNVTVSDTGDRLALELSNGALVPTHGRHVGDAHAGVTLDRTTLAMLALGAVTPDQVADRLQVEGDATRVATLFGLCDGFDRSFPIVTP
jgi:alkyl sulfatase BDS1-like metallo-beta-lactamase superfamily hydrolase